MTLRVLAALSAALLAVSFSVSSADAARGSAKPGPTAYITLNETNPRVGDTVTFAYSGTKGGETRIDVVCYGNSVMPLWSADQVAGTAFVLGGADSEWLTSGAPADCVAILYKRSTTDGELAHTNFHVDGIAP